MIMPPENRGDQIVMRGRTLAEVVVFESSFLSLSSGRGSRVSLTESVQFLAAGVLVPCWRAFDSHSVLITSNALGAH